jgi:hypothetical protein
LPESYIRTIYIPWSFFFLTILANIHAWLLYYDSYGFSP